MQRISVGYHNMNGFSRIMLVLLLPFVILVVAYGSYILFFIEDPVITGLDEFEFLPVNKTVNIRCENVKSIEISVYQGGSKIDLLVDKPQLSETTYSLEIKPRDLNLKDGSAIIIAKAKSGLFKKVKLEVRSTIDTLPPTLEVLKSPSILN